jgi:hypothetical protein
MIMKDPNRLFSLCIRSIGVTIHAFDANVVRGYCNKIDILVSQRGKVIFRSGKLYCGCNVNRAIDSDYAKALVLDTVAMKPGDADADYFSDYSEEQLSFARSFGDVISAERDYRYGDKL